MPEHETGRDGPPELWGGVECTVNRVGDSYHDQLERNGHGRRASDLDLFAALGLAALRYPLLWERTAPRGVDSAAWGWADAGLARLRGLGVRPILGLVHHGSGPPHTSLVDQSWPEQLASFAGAVAARYPWVTDYTPVNEPLTTARFSGLYGHWYPHGRDDRTFVRALLTQVRAVVLSMRAVREVNPAARLVQTEDLGKTYSTRALRYQADFENERRWLTFDLLCGRVGGEHPVRPYLLRAGASERDLGWFLDNPCPPDVIGVNHYLTSERFLDERVERYPASARGGNGRRRYADVEAVRVLSEGLAGVGTLLGEAWGRYGLPLAVTEAHLGCTREEQMRWLAEVWESACAARGAGVDVRAVTAWALLGLFDWDSLVTRDAGRYEPGVFDLRGGRPRATALAGLVKDLAAGRRPDHPVLAAPGWWRRLDRLIYLPVRRAAAKPAGARGWAGVKRERPRTILITGATGTLGNAFARVCHARAVASRLLKRGEMDIADAASVESALNEYEPWAVINAAGYVRVDDAEREPERCMRENADGPAVLAAACAARGVALVTFSSDMVFDGAAREPYVEEDAPAPPNVYGRSKAEAESRVLAAHAGALIVRTSAFFGPWDEYNFVVAALRSLAAGERFAAAGDAVVSPTYVPDLAHASLDLLIDGERGLWHLANQGATTWAELARRAARIFGLDAGLVHEVSTADLGLAAVRPAYGVLGSSRGALLPSLEDALSRFAREHEVTAAAGGGCLGGAAAAPGLR